MPNKNKSTTQNISSEPPTEEKLYTGYLHKSPFLSKGMKSWKKRLFVLSKTGEKYHLFYYRNHDKKGKIDLSRVSKIGTCPEDHQMWNWIQENFKCSSASVLLLRVEDFMPKHAREYFLIGENSEEVDQWIKELLKVLKTQTSENTVQVTDDSLQQKNRSISAPLPNSEDCDEELVRNRSRMEKCLSEQSDSLCIFTFKPMMGDVSDKLSDITLSDDDSDDMEEQPETTEDSAYIDMASVRKAFQQEEEDRLETNESADSVDSSQDLCNAVHNKDKERPMPRAALRRPKGSISEMNGNCVSTDMNEVLLNKRETLALVETEISITRNDLDTSLIFTEEDGKLRVSECKQTESLFHKGDQILAFNDVLIDSVEEIQKFTKRLSKDEAKLTVLRQPGSEPLHLPPKTTIGTCTLRVQDNRRHCVTSAKDLSNSIQMFTKQRSTPTAKFYNNNEPSKVEELYSGYMHKSPAFTGITKGKGKAWKRRFFVLYKMGEDTYHLAYYRNNEKREKPLRKIDLSKVDLIFSRPENHQMWDHIQKTFKCPSASVLRLRVVDFMPKCPRDYFLIGENSEEVDKWEKELLKVIKTLGNKVQVKDDGLQKGSRLRAISEPIPKSPPYDEGMKANDLNPFRLSAPTFAFRTTPESHYAVPSNFPSYAPCKEDFCSDDDDEDDTEENTEDGDIYMNMASVQEVLARGVKNDFEEDACFQTNTPTVTKAVESSQDLCNAADNQKKESSMRKNSAELRCSKGSLSDFNGNFASTEINKSETQEPVEKEIYVKLNDLRGSLIFTQEQGKLCLSECKKNETSHMFHKGDQIVAFNDLLIDSAEEIQEYIKKLSKDEVKLTIRRYLGSQPFHAVSFSTT
ncbi:uncharacterized protein LOC130439399 [Triplophysa dalaica]|uniref:uncharacterized protein LOC130439399 n=1 Tax=Triplophysa dalaica TaxID=1582913 RepID=UPI0024E015B5|nr:uncharacterized protein LOC130439399 [Triplophysa dalaica]